MGGHIQRRRIAGSVVQLASTVFMLVGKILVPGATADTSVQPEPNLTSIQLSQPVVYGQWHDYYPRVNAKLIFSGVFSTPSAEIQLKSSDNLVASVPENIKVLHSNLRDIPIFVGSVKEAVHVEITASYNGQEQSALLTVLPPKPPFVINGLISYIGNSCCALFWSPIPDGVFKGYNIYRLTPDSPAVLLNQRPQQANMFADTGLNNGEKYTYFIAPVELNGCEDAQSAPVSAIPSQSLPTLSWYSKIPPQAPNQLSLTEYSIDSYKPPRIASGVITLASTLSSGSVPLLGCYSLVDGRNETNLGTADSAFGMGVTIPSGIVQLVHSTQLANGIHTFQTIALIDQNSVCATPPLKISVKNTISNMEATPIVYNHRKSIVVRATLTSIFPWTASISDADGAILKSWSGKSVSVHLMWSLSAGISKSNDTQIHKYIVAIEALDPHGLSPVGGFVDSGVTSESCVLYSDCWQE